MLAVPRDSPNCKKHSEEKNSHEREYNIGKDLNLKIVLTKKCGAKFYKTKLRVRKYKGLSLPKNQEKGKKKIGLFDIGIGITGERNKKTPLILIPSTTSTKWNLARKPIDLQRKKTKKTNNVNFNSAF